MKVSDNEGLEIVTKIINESISTKKIHCFLEKKEIKSYKNLSKNGVELYKEHTHFHILVLTDKYTLDGAFTLSSIIKVKTKGRYSATILLYPVG
ncbi:hypothetical protein [Flavobacterium hercynium]|uniref:Uncharacterized protein n=1 Tax=Flavobacterium hercynium TaxID=387094 RepID=A0A226H2U9_9FLAO|nr:hypothetical protein [Flavobacterium hercynium]OXA88374.1 hypothetical protein B0A66_15660 [Flavobacterium hercynium]SMP30675.1 hypothetical protein SAMN06265346_113115 [Flavobacterium hercynium]